MPIYEFECGSCGHRFDRLQKLSDPDPSACPECGGPSISRCLTAPAFRLAGSGWYETDFKKDGDNKRNLAGVDEPPKPAAEKTAASDGKTPESKPATKSEPKTTKANAPAPSKQPKESG